MSAGRKSPNSFYCRQEPGRAEKESFRADKRQEETLCTQIYRYVCVGQGNHLLLKFAINNVKKMTTVFL